MSVTSRPDACPDCGTAQLGEVGRIEAGEFTAPCREHPAGIPPADCAIYRCENGHEWDFG